MFQKLIYSLFPGLLKNQLKVLIAGTIEGDKQKKGKLHDLLERLGDSIEGALREVIMDPDDQDDPYEANIALKKRYPKREYAEQGIERYTWENALGEGQVRPLRFFVPTIFQELLDAVKFAENRGLKVKAVATGHSYSDITKTQDVLISMLNLNSPLELPKSSFKEGVDSSNFFNTQAGIRLRELNDAMDQAGLALPTMPGVDLQTLGGAISSATHGSSMEYASLSELVRSLVVVSSDNKVYRIEPSDGITDPSKHDEPGVELVQDDDWFNSVTCSMGCMGIIYSIVIEVIPSYMLSETKTLTTWDEVKKGLESGELFEGNRHLEIMINPYKIDGTHKTLVLHQEIVSDQEPTGNRKFSFLATLVDILPVGRKLLKWYANTFPEKTPQLIDTSLNGLVQTEPFINKSYKVLNQGLMEIKDDGLATEMALPFDKYIGAVDHLIEMINQMKRRRRPVYDLSNIFAIWQEV